MRTNAGNGHAHKRKVTKTRFRNANAELTKAIGIEYEYVCWKYSIVNLQQEATAGEHRLVALDLLVKIFEVPGYPIWCRYALLKSNRSK